MMSEKNLKYKPFKSGQIGGIITVIVFSFLSMAAIAFVTCLAIYRTLRGKNRPREAVFFCTQLGYYAACLLACNLISSFVGVLEIGWVVKGGIQEGPLCTAQGIMSQIANIGTAYFVSSLAIHTFLSFVLRWKSDVRGVVSIIVGWGITIGISLAPFLQGGKEQRQYGIVSITCGVKRRLALSNFLYHIIPIFLGSVISAVVSALIFLFLRGTLSFKGGLKLNLHPEERWNGRVGTWEEYHRFIASISRSILWLPIAYLILVLPYTLTMIADLSGYVVPFDVYVFAQISWLLLGVANVALLYNTFRVLGASLESVSKLVAHWSGTESFVSSEKNLPDGGFQDPSITNSSSAATPVAQLLQSNPLRSANDPFNYQPNQLYPSPSSSRLVPGSIGHQRSTTASSSTSSMHRLVVTQQAIAAGHGDPPNPDSDNAAAIGRLITPVSTLNREISIAVPEPALSRNSGLSRLQTTHLRSESLGSEYMMNDENPSSLPPAPRPNRSPVSRRPTAEGIARTVPAPGVPSETSNTGRGDDAATLPWATLVENTRRKDGDSPVAVVRDGPSRKPGVSSFNTNSTTQSSSPENYV